MQYMSEQNQHQTKNQFIEEQVVASDVTPAVIKLSKTRPKHNRAATHATPV